ncbi:MAG TPA: hypothetical protein VGL03_00700 [Thermoanaerobaculia bacterium]|jgi:tetratricopeptide (TPR) repeat protein
MLSPARRSSAALWLLALTLVSGYAAAQDSVPPQTRAVRSPGNADWAKDATEARSRAASQNKLVYFEFESSGCGNCRRMQALLYPAFDFESLLIRLVPVKLQFESPEGKLIAERYSIEDAPAVLITTPEGRLVFRMQGFKDAADFYSHVHKDLDTYRQFAKRIDAQDIASLSAEEAYATGRELYSRLDPQAALPRLKRATVAPHPQPGLRESALEGLAAVELELGEAAQARKSIDQLIAMTKNLDQRERAELFRAQIPLSQNNPAEALALYKKFEKDHPGSKYRDKVKSFIERLQPTTSNR